MRVVVHLTAKIVTGTCLAMITPAEASTIYWSHSATLGTQNTISAADSDGRWARELFFTGGLPAPEIALDTATRQLFYTHGSNQSGSEIWRASIYGGGSELIVARPDTIDSLAIDATRGNIYWVDLHERQIMRANLDGTGIASLDLFPPQSVPFHVRGLWIDEAAGQIYWGTLDAIHRANFDGTDMETVLANGVAFPQSIAFDPVDNQLFWMNVLPPALLRADLDTVSISMLAPLDEDPVWNQHFTIDLVERRLYWPTPTRGTISSMGFDGADRRDVVELWQFTGARDIAIDPHRVPEPSTVLLLSGFFVELFAGWGFVRRLGAVAG